MGRRAGRSNKHSFPSSSRGYSMQTSGLSKVNRYHAFEEDSSETADATEKYVIKQDSDDDENLEVVEADKSEFQEVESKKQKEVNKNKEELLSCFDKIKENLDHFLDKQKQRVLKEVDNNKKFNFIALNEKFDEVFQENFFELNFQKLKGKKGCVYSPERFLHEAREFANMGRNVIATELVWGAFSCSLCRFYESLKINIESHSATNVLCRILISCHTCPMMLESARRCASEAHRAFYKNVKVDDLKYHIGIIEEFKEELKKMNKEAVKDKFLKSIKNHRIDSEEFGVVQVYEGKHMDFVFGVEGEFDYRVSLPVKHEKKRNYQKFDTNHATNLLRKKRRAIDLKTLEENKGLPKCNLKNGAIYGEEEKRIKARILNNNNGLLTQIVHPSFPKERDWVMVTGIERVVDGVLICSLSYGGRLVSMGHFLDLNGRLNYYAIMHKYNGPVFLKPEPMPYAKLLKDAQENEELDLALTQICGQDNDGNGKVYFSTYWERVAGVNTRIWFPGSPESDMQKNIFEREGFRLINLCGYSVRNRTAHYVGIWQKQLNENLFSRPYEARYGLTLNECLEINDKLSSRQYVAVQFRVFRNLDEILCCAIWEYLPGHKHWIEIDINLKKMHNKFQRTLFKRKFKRSTKFISSPILPRQISHFFDVNDGSLRFVVLWSNVNWMRFPKEEQLWPPGSKIPFTYLPGVESNLLPNQLVFVAKRVERFLRELDIPGLSVAISKDEKLKYAAGFGYSNVRRKQLVTPDHQFRIGSVSKPITAAAILLLVDQGHLYLDKRVFGIGNSIFGNVFARKKPYGKWVTEITVRHLLEHTAGGWNNIDSDPAWLLPTKNTFELIEHVITEQPLIIKPGKVWIYSNFGYQLLGYIIEKINLDGLDYEQFVKKFIWEKVGVKDVQLGRPTLSEKARREVLYYMAGGNRLGFNPYDLLPAERMGPWGGWIASPIELLRLLIYLDGFKKREDILSDWAIKEWIIPTIASNETYGLGWSLNIMGFNGWQHDGRMPGSASMLVRLDNGISMAVVVNKEYSDRDFFHELGYILHHFGNNYDWWNSSNVDLFNREVIEN